MSTDEITATVIAAVAIGLGLLLTVAFRLLSRLLDSVGSAWIDKLDDDRTRTRVNLAKDGIKTASQLVAQTIVPEVRAAAADGKIDPEERAHILRTAIGEAKRRFGIAFWTDLMERLGLPTTDVDAWIAGQLESYVFESKQGASPPDSGQTTAETVPGEVPGMGS